jgi:hypothetical protein
LTLRKPTLIVRMTGDVWLLMVSGRIHAQV